VKEILKNTALGLVWLALTIGQVRLIGTMNKDGQMNTVLSLVLWLGGQLIILSPILWYTWKTRHVGDAPSSG